MPNLPGATRLGQGIPGGRSSLPGEITGSGPPGSIPVASAFPKLSTTFDAPAVPRNTLAPVHSPGLASNQNSVPSRKAYSLATALALIDRVHQGTTPWQDAQKILRDLPDDERNALQAIVIKRFGSAPNPAGARGVSPQAQAGYPLDELRALSRPSPTGGGILSHLASDTTSFVKGFVPGMVLASKAVGSDVGAAIAHPLRESSIYNYATGGKQPVSQTNEKVLKPIATQEKDLWGPLVTGHPGEFARKVSDHPLAPLFDVFAVASAGVGGAGRIAAAARATKAADVTRGAEGVVEVGAKAGINLKVVKNRDTWRVVDRGRPVASRFPDEKSAIAHAQSLATGGLSGNAFKVAMNASTRGGPQGSLINAFEKARGETHEAEHLQIMDEIASVLDNPNLRLNRRTLREVLGDVKADLVTTAHQDIGRPGEMAKENPQFYSSKGIGTALTAGGVTIREASDLVRAGAIYVRPAYLPNNWAGNLFMNAVHQGVYAPINLAKSLVMDKYIGARYTRAIDQSLGTNAAEVVTAGKGRGYVGSVTQPMAHIMGAIADQPFRRAAWLHEARRRGYDTLPKIKALVDDASQYATSAQGAKSLRTMSEIARSAQEEIVKFGRHNEIERGVLRNLVFVYSWMRGAGRYAGRFPFQHPIQTAIYNHQAQQGNAWLEKNMGGAPSFLVGAIPVGRDKNGNPILINPFSLNPLGTGLQLLQAAEGTAKIAKSMGESLIHGRRPSGFNEFAQTDLISLANPLAQGFIAGHEGKTVDLQSPIAPIKLIQDLKHPGRGGIYPTTRKEAIGHFVGGSLYPRKASQAAITKSLEREGANNPLALIPDQVARYKKLTGDDLPPEFVAAYQADVVASQQQKDFQKTYAERHGQSGFRNLPPQNQAEAALEYYRRHKLISQRELDSISDDMRGATTDEEFKLIANTLWSGTGAGSIKRMWNQAMNEAKQGQLSRRRP